MRLSNNLNFKNAFLALNVLLAFLIGGKGGYAIRSFIKGHRVTPYQRFYSKPLAGSRDFYSFGELRSVCNICLVSCSLIYVSGILSACQPVLADASFEATAKTATSPISVVDSSSIASDTTVVSNLMSDEFELTIDSEQLGLTLTEIKQMGYPIIAVKAVRDESLLRNSLLRPGVFVTRMNSVSCEGLSLKKVSELFKSLDRPITMTFRDPEKFYKLLDSSQRPLARTITTQYLPANTRDQGAPEQIIKVERLSGPFSGDIFRSAQVFDVLEIEYVAQIVGRDAIVDSSAERAPPGSSKGSIYYILGQQNGPPGKYPPGWDLTLRGMIPGEKRRITLPYTLAYDRSGLKSKGIPPYANLVYIVKLVSIT